MKAKSQKEQTRVYLQCVVTRNDGTTFANPLKLSGIRFVSQLAQEHKSVKVEKRETTETIFRAIFG